MGRLKRRGAAFVTSFVLVSVLLIPASAAADEEKFLTAEDAMLTLGPGAPAGSSILPLISSGDEIGDFKFQGLPDGIGIRDNTASTVRVFVAHEETTVPFFGSADFQNASVSVLTLDKASGEIIHAEVGLGPEENLLRLCSAYQPLGNTSVPQRFFFVNEETNDWINRATGEAMSDPDWKALEEKPAGWEQAGVVAALNTNTGKTTLLYSMGRLNHENTVALPGYGKPVLVTTDDTFNAPSAQLYMWITSDKSNIRKDKGRLLAFQVTATDAGPVDPTDPFNDANDYLDIQPGDDWQGRFIRVPEDVARGDQDALENWSNDNNVFQFIRLEDLAVDRADPSVLYVADTGRTRIEPDPATGRLLRGPDDTGAADNGRVFKMVFDKDFPRRVNSFSVLADGDAVGTSAFVPMSNPDNMDTSFHSLMVQEDADDAQIWRYNLKKEEWTVVANVTDPEGESSGIVHAARWFGQGAWIVDVQAHGFPPVEEQTVGEVTMKLEAGQLLLLRLPGT